MAYPATHQQGAVWDFFCFNFLRVLICFIFTQSGPVSVVVFVVVVGFFLQVSVCLH